MIVQLLVDNRNSWVVPYAIKLKELLINKFNFSVYLIYNHGDVIKGDVLCLLSCEKIFKKLNYNYYNLVVHESDLPYGKGWSPLTWQVLEGKCKIPITLFEAAEEVDSGKIYAQEVIELNGSELLSEIKHKQGLKTIDLIFKFFENFPMEGEKQKGKETFYKRRTLKDSELDIHKTISEQFDLLRISDNKRYPAYFLLNGVKYFLRITKE